tara:strand:+ start:127 stop:579 length:453 start_codon:yes stop_codon:yes gene_type:complete
MDTKEKAALALLKKLGYKISKIKKKSIAPELMNGAFGEAAASIIKTKNLTIRKIFLKAIKSKFFDACLDTLFTGTKRAAFDDKGEKLWSERFQAAATVTKDITSKGQFKRFKLIERYVKLNLNAAKALYDPDYRPAGDKVMVRKRKYKKK